MSALITVPILDQAFERILDQVCIILATELNNQFVLTYNPVLDLDGVYKERRIAFNHSQLPAVNVTLDSGEYSKQDATQTDGTYRYLIECVTFAKSTIDNLGDSLSKIKCNRLIGVVRAILEDPRYMKLGFNDIAFIEHREIEMVEFGRMGEGDACHVMYGRLALTVRAPEYPAQYVEGVPVGGSDTTVKLDLTDEGYIWKLTE